MKNTYYNLYIGKTNEIPKDEKGKEFEVVYCLEKGKEISDDLEKNPNLKYYLIVLQKTETDLNKRMLNVKAEWNRFTDLNREIEHITDNLIEIKRNFRELLLESETETVIFKSQVVGFDENTKTELNAARKLILGVATKSNWNFWN